MRQVQLPVGERALPEGAMSRKIVVTIVSVVIIGAIAALILVLVLDRSNSSSGGTSSESTANTGPSTSGRTATIHGLTIPLKAEWKAEESSIIDTSTCVGQADCVKLDIIPPEVLQDWSDEKQLDYPPCDNPNDPDLKFYSHPDPEPVRKGEKSVGGVMAQYYEMRLCPSELPQATMRYWLFPDKRALLTVYETNGRKFDGLDDALAAATWN